MAELYPLAKAQFFDNNGEILSLGTVEITYTTTGNPAPTYTDSIRSAQNEYPIKLTAAGKADIYLVSGSFNIVTKDRFGVIVDTTYNYVIEEMIIPELTAGNVPIGSIIMYNGLLAALPDDWHLCDGLAGTPDLTDRFIRGTTLQDDIGDEGGTEESGLIEHTHTMAHQHSIDHNHASVSGNTNDTGAHTHKGVMRIAWYGTGCNQAGGGYLASEDYWDKYTDSAGSHKHTFSVNLPNYTGTSGASTTASTGSAGDSEEGTNLPPYYTLAFIQRIA